MQMPLLSHLPINCRFLSIPFLLSVFTYMLAWYERIMQQMTLGEEGTQEQMIFLETFYDIAVVCSSLTAQ